VTELRTPADDRITHERGLSEGARNSTILRFAEGLKEKINVNNGSLDFQDLRSELQRFGELTGESARKGETTASETAKKIFAAGRADLDAAAASGDPARPAVGALKEFNPPIARDRARRSSRIS
jgi:hypothetical protein